ncbi:MAG: beta-galactosidase [Pseudolysinimonas sp.]
MNDKAPYSPDFSGVLFGAAYYAEYQFTDRMDEDLDLMAAAGFTVIRVGESVWSTWEPRDGEFELEWLLPVLDGAHARGIGVILGTPTYAIPPWLQVKHPELAGQRATGVPTPWGSRQEVDYSQPLFRGYAERIIRAVVSRYATHPAVIGFQVDNEPGLFAFHNPLAFEEFVERLKRQYGDVETLNREWGLTYWSHRIAEWTELWVPDGNQLPQYDLAWRRYQADLTTEFIAWQASIVREYSSPEQFVTTCMQYPRPSQHDVKLAAELDVTAANPYYGMQEHLAFDKNLLPITHWSTTGVWGLLRQGDRAWASKQARYLVTETNAQSISGAEQNYPGYPGQLRLAALALISRGAAMIEYWQWQTLNYGTETYWGGVLPHSQRPGRVYREVAEIGALLKELGGALDGFVPDADITLVYSNESKWAFEFTPPLHTDAGLPERTAYSTIFDAFHRGVIESGAQARIVHTSQFGADPTTFASQHPVLVVPALYVVTDDELTFLRDYATAGGHLVVGIRTAYADEEARARVAVAPPELAEPAGVWYEEYSNLDAPVAVTGTSDFATSDGARATRWLDSLELDGAETILGYDHPEFGRFPAITTRVVGAGRISYVGTVPNPALAADIARWLVAEPIAAEWSREASVTVASGTAAAGVRLWFISNWSSDVATVTAPHAVTSAVTAETFAAHHTFSLEPWASLVLVDE